MNPSNYNAFDSFSSGETRADFDEKTIIAGGNEEQSITASQPKDIFLGSISHEKKSRKKWIIAIVIFVFLLGLAVSGYFIWRYFNEGRVRNEEDAAIRAMSALEVFDNYYDSMVYGPVKNNETEMSEEWYFEGVIRAGINDDEERWLENLKKYYGVFWEKVEYNDEASLVYDGLFNLYYNFSNREVIVSEVEKIRSEDGDEVAMAYVDNLINIDDFRGALAALAFNESQYFKDSSMNGYLSSVLDIVNLTMPSFKEKTKEIQRRLEIENVQE